MDEASEQVSLLTIWPLADLGVDAVITTRAGGISPPPYDSLNLGLHVADGEDRVVTNRERLASTYGCHLDDMVFLDQCHGTRVATVGADHAGRGSRAIEHALSATDAAVTTTPGLPLVVQVADCTPIVLVDPVAGVLGVAHAGWRGAVAGIGSATVSAMVLAGAEIARLHAWLGPDVDVDRYEVGPEVVAAAQACGAGAAVVERSGTTRLDMTQLNRLLLESAGIPAGQITQSELTTQDPRLFSDRHARPCGRFAVVARLTGGRVVASEQR